MPSSNIFDFDEINVEHNPITGRYHLAFDLEKTSRPSMVVVYLVSHLTDTPPLSLPQIQSAVDTDRLDTWIPEVHAHTDNSEIIFTYAGYRITLDTLGNIWVESIDDPEGNIDGGGSDSSP